ncbi:MAG: hypothetical protein GY796_23550 [Chloroflexi bacterium]|nr:hypothetical protein [Chloroflexota bacterium]
MSKFRILCFDGGGIRGLYTAVLLNRIASDVPELLQDIQLYAGTSTGGLLALGLASGRSPENTIQLYLQYGPQIFSRSWWHKIWSLWGLIKAKYDNVALREAVATELGEQTMEGLAQQGKHVLISGFELDGVANGYRSWKPKFFHNFPGPTGDAAELLADVAMRTSAAPTYFPSYQGFVDGGVVANSPTMAALAQAMDQATGNQQLADIRLISFGTGKLLRFIEGTRNDWGALQWARPAIPMMLEGSMDVQNYECGRILGPSQYHRLAEPLPEPIELDEVEEMDKLVQFANEVDIEPTVDWIRMNFL